MMRLQLHSFPKAWRPSRRQRGASMLFALIALVVLTLGGVALVRTVDTGLLTLGNLGFRRDTLSAGAESTELALTWLGQQAPATLFNSDSSKGYYATAVANLAPLDTTTSAAHPVSLVDWKGDACGGASVDDTRLCLSPSTQVTFASGVKAQYVVTRLCSVVGSGGSSRPCAVPLRTSAGLSMDRGVYGALGKIEPPTATTFYRIITRTEGARGSVAFTETLVHF